MDHCGGVFLAALGLGLAIAYGRVARETVGALMDWHKLFGVIVLVFGLWRIGRRVTQGFQAPAAPVPHWQELASKVVHVGLLVASLAMPLSGVLITLAGGCARDARGVTLLPSNGEIRWLDTTASAVHEFVPWLVVALLALHVGAPLKHPKLDRDASLTRMASREPLARSEGARCHGSSKSHSPRAEGFRVGDEVSFKRRARGHPMRPSVKLRIRPILKVLFCSGKWQISVARKCWADLVEGGPFLPSMSTCIAAFQSVAAAIHPSAAFFTMPTNGPHSMAAFSFGPVGRAQARQCHGNHEYDALLTLLALK